MLQQFSANAASGYQFDSVPDLSRATVRERLSQSSMDGFFAVADKWNLSIQQRLDLLGGGISRSKLFAMRSGAGIRRQDELMRISYVIAIYKALHILLPPELADVWMTRPNQNLLFRGQSPLALAQRNGIPGLQQIRRFLDASRGGV